MTRPRKQVVDYFSHDADASEGRTLSILQHKFGNDGYAFWFHLLELLARTEGHFYDCNPIENWEFLVAKTRLDGISAPKIIDTLAKLSAIDSVLWEHKVIFSQNFVNRLADVYKKRNSPLPPKPSFCNGNCHHIGILGSGNPPSLGIPDTDNPQSTVKDSTVKDSSNPPTPLTLKTTTTTTQDTDKHGDTGFALICQTYENEIGMLTPAIGEQIKAIYADSPDGMPTEAWAGWIVKALAYAATQNIRKWSYALATLKGWQAQGWTLHKKGSAKDGKGQQEVAESSDVRAIKAYQRAKQRGDL